MKKRLALVTGLISFVLLSVSYAYRSRTLCEGFLPKNDYKIYVNDVNALGIKEDVFNSVLDRAQALYGPIIAERGAKLQINRLWKDPTVNASAEQKGKVWHINMYGGLARHKTVTAEGFALVVCHELGHHLGGFPLYQGDDWATNEGGADYFATLKCLRKVFPGATVPTGTDAFAAKACNDSFPAGADRNRCLSNTLAGQSVAFLFQALSRTPAPPQFNTPDPAVVSATEDGHPDTQCRLDTYFQGALCTKPVSEDVSKTSPLPGSCTAAGGFTQGFRPLCWYHPADGEAAPANIADRPVSLPSEKALNEKINGLSEALSGNGR